MEMMENSVANSVANYCTDAQGCQDTMEGGKKGKKECFSPIRRTFVVALI